VKWTDDRCTELDKFRELLTEVQSINRGSHILERLARCITIAEALDKVDLQRARASFYQFLNDLAVEERSDAAHAPSTKE
jgi:hypothetical protein